MSVVDAAQKINAVVLDVDGVLTDGRIGYGAGSKDRELKFFHARDGLGIKLLRRAGLAVGALSGRRSRANTVRAGELRLSFLRQNAGDKAGAFITLLQEQELEAERCLYVGDDLVDIPVMQMAGVAVAVADACAEVLQVADWCTSRSGGHGAVREVAEWLLKTQGRWQESVAPYLESDEYAKCQYEGD